MYFSSICVSTIKVYSRGGIWTFLAPLKLSFVKILIFNSQILLLIELLAKERLSRTHLFHPHGLILAKYVNPRTLKKQIGFAYGCGQLCGFKGYKKNAVKVPNPKFTYKNDPSRFKSLHCHIFPDASLCKS
jgi:hypothetical protein